MRVHFGFRNLSLTSKLISSYLVILGIGGLATSVLGSWIVSSTIMNQAYRSVVHDLATARMIYEERLSEIRQAVALSVAGTTIPDFLERGDTEALHSFLQRIRLSAQLDFLTLTDDSNRVLVRATAAGSWEDGPAMPGFLEAARQGVTRVSTELVAESLLAAESKVMSERARIGLRSTPHAIPSDKTQVTSGLVMISAAPVYGGNGGIVGVLYGGVLVNRNLGLVDQVWETLYKGQQFEGKNVGTVTVFLDDVRVSTTVRTEDGERALGTRVSREVYETVVGRGERWVDRAFVVQDWYISAYEPIRDHDQRVVGMLYVGLLEEAYTSITNRVILTFFFIASVGFVLILVVTYLMIRSITRPIAEMVSATKEISRGRFDLEVSSTSGDEIGHLAGSFNTMLGSLRQMKGDLEEWARTLEIKVRERTDELVAMQAKVAQSDRLASLGKLAAGVAHEINNPLGGIMSLTALTLEDLEKEDPNRENLEEVIKQTRRCRDIVMGLLEFSRESELRSHAVDLNKILQDTLGVVDKQAMFFNVELVKRWDLSLPPVMADESQLQQVFMNIIINAVQAMEERGILTIETRYDRAFGFSDVLITDTGVGISPDKIHRIFDPFFTTKSSEHGTGLGLSIAYGIVVKHGGTISVESEPGKGSTFTVRLPSVLEVPEADLP